MVSDRDSLVKQWLQDDEKSEAVGIELTEHVISEQKDLSFDLDTLRSILAKFKQKKLSENVNHELDSEGLFEHLFRYFQVAVQRLQEKQDQDRPCNAVLEQEIKVEPVNLGTQSLVSALQSLYPQTASGEPALAQPYLQAPRCYSGPGPPFAVP